MAELSMVSASGRANNRPVLVAATATPGTVIHTAGSGTVNWDDVAVEVTNSDSSARTLTLEFGGVTDPDDLPIRALSIPIGGECTPVYRNRIQNSLVIRAFASSANKLLLTVTVNRMS